MLDERGDSVLLLVELLTTISSSNNWTPRLETADLCASAAVGLVSEVGCSSAAPVVRTRLACVLGARGSVDGSSTRAGRGLRGALTLAIVVLVLEAAAATGRARRDGGLWRIVVHAFPASGATLPSITA